MPAAARPETRDRVADDLGTQQILNSSGFGGFLSVAGVLALLAWPLSWLLVRLARLVRRRPA